jgi:hypothetical protein
MCQIILAGLEYLSRFSFAFKKQRSFVIAAEQQLLDFGRSWDRICSDAGITGLYFHVFAVEMLDGGAENFMIQTALGHSQINTPKIFAQVQNEGLRASLERLAEGENFYHFAIIQPTDNFENKKRGIAAPKLLILLVPTTRLELVTYRV